jgi:hypothetical protein
MVEQRVLVPVLKQQPPTPVATVSTQSNMHVCRCDVRTQMLHACMHACFVRGSARARAVLVVRVRASGYRLLIMIVVNSQSMPIQPKKWNMLPKHMIDRPISDAIACRTNSTPYSRNCPIMCAGGSTQPKQKHRAGIEADPRCGETLGQR